MDQNDEKYFEDMFAMFRTKGWKRLSAELEATQAELNKLRRYKESNDFFYAQGQESAINDITSLPDRTQEAYELAMEQDKSEEDTEGSSFNEVFV